MKGYGKTRTLLCVDGSEQSVNAAVYLSGMLRKDLSEISIFHVLDEVPETCRDLNDPPLNPGRLAPLMRETEGRMMEFMNGLRNIFIEAGFSSDRVHVHLRRRTAGVARDILAVAEADFSLIVIGRTGGGGFKNLIIGSVANKVLGYAGGVTLCIVSGRPQPGPVLLALDPSIGSERALDVMAGVIAPQDRPVVLYHAARRLRMLAESPENPEIRKLEEDFFKEDRERMRPVLEGARGRLTVAGFDPERIEEVLETGVASRAWAVVRWSRKAGGDTIFVGRRGLSRVEEFFMGRVSNKVVMLAENQAVWIAA